MTQGFLMDYAVVSLPFGGRDVSRLINEHLISKNVLLTSFSFDIQDIIENIKVRSPEKAAVCGAPARNFVSLRN